jgi:ParB/RepB/Spo0J family partition protein
MNAPAPAASLQISAPEYHEIPLTTILISDTPLQVLRRKRFTTESLAELAADIKTRGVMEPILVRPVAGKPAGIKYELIFGERRWLASRDAGLAHIPALIRPMTDTEAIGAQFAENMEREGLHELEEAEGYQMLCRAHKCDAKALITRGIVSKNEAHVHARLKLLDLGLDVRTDFYAGKINASIALLIARIRDPKQQQKALKGCLTGNDLGKYIIHYEGALTFADAKQYIHEEFIVYQDGAAAIEAAKKKGLPAKGMIETQDLWKRHWAPPAGHIIVDDYKDQIGEQPAGAVLMQNPHNGEAKLVLRKDKAIALFKEKKIGELYR